MRKTILGAATMLFVLLGLSGPASAQAPDLVYCGPGVGYAAVCPDDVVRPTVDGTVSSGASGALPRTGSDSSLPLAKFALVLIGVGGAMMILANRRRHLRIPA